MQPEHILQSHIITKLCSLGYYASNHTVGEFYPKTGAKIHIGTHGESDIWGVTPTGRAFFLEVKMPGKKPRQDQLDFLEAMKKQNAIAGWCTSVEEAVEIVQQSQAIQARGHPTR